MSIWSWLNRRRLDEADLQEEIQAHLKIAADERMSDGADPQRAQLESLKEFGNVTLTREAAHRVWTPRWLDALHDQVSDVRYAIRSLAKKGWVTAKWGQTGANQRAKFYRLTPEGKKQLVREESRWAVLVNAIARVMKPASAPGEE